MEFLLPLVLGLLGGAIAGFAIAYFAFVGKLQKKLVSAKKKLDRAQSASEGAESLQAQLVAERQAKEGLQAQLQSLEATHQAQLAELESQHGLVLQDWETRYTAIATELETQQNQTPDESQAMALQEVQDRLAATEQQCQDYQQYIEAQKAHYEAHIEQLEQALAALPPSPPVEAREPETDPNLLEKASGWGAAAVAGGIAAVGAGMAAVSQWGQAQDTPQETEETPEVTAEMPFGEELASFETPEVTAEMPFGEELAGFETPEITAEMPFGEELASFETPEITTEMPFGEELTGFETPEITAETPFGEELASFETPEVTAEMPFGEELAGFETPEITAETPFGASWDQGPDLENWVDSPETAEDVLSELPSLDAPEPWDEGSLETPSPLEGLEDLSLASEELDLLAELTQEGEGSMDLLGVEETSLELPVPETDLSELGDLSLGEDLPSTPEGLDLPEDFFGEGSEEIQDIHSSGNDDLDFLLELQEDEPLPNPEESLLLPDLTEEEPFSAGFADMELLPGETPDLGDLLGDSPSLHEGDPFINILDDHTAESDQDLLALLQEEDLDGPGSGEEDLFMGLEGMLEENTPQDNADLDDLEALLNGESSHQGEEELLSLEDLGLGEDFR